MKCPLSVAISLDDETSFPSKLWDRSWNVYQRNIIYYQFEKSCVDFKKKNLAHFTWETSHVEPALIISLTLTFLRSVVNESWYLSF